MHTPNLPPFQSPPTTHPPNSHQQAACDGCVRQALQERGFQCPFPPGVCKRGQGHPVGQEQLHPTSYVRDQVCRCVAVRGVAWLG